jgi:O-antigen/teichoic acid export membrane protein
MQQSYTFNYLKIYLWQGISIILNLLSMFIVIPRLADNPTIYGIYVVCISANIFLTYADIGFASAGYKYASECFAQKNLEEEIRIVAFVLFALTVSTVAWSPGLLIKDIRSAAEITIASHLMFILAFFSPVIIFQRVLDIIYGVRLEQFVLQRIMIGASILKILSVFYFFQYAHYDIVGYFLFCQMVNATALLSCAIIAKIRYQHNFFVFFKAFKFSKPMFNKTKALAFGSLFLTVTWILYYELDAFAIAKLLGPESVAIYAVGFTVLTFMRTLYGTLFSPFFARFNHFIGLNDMDGLRRLYLSIVTLTLPFVVFPILSLFLLMDSFVNAWVGSHYEDSVLIAQLLILCFIYGFISYPASFLIIAQERIRILYVTAAIAPIIYWTGIALTIHFMGLTSLALFKLIVMSLSGVIYFVITIKFLRFSPWSFAKRILGPAVIPVAFLCGALLYFGQFMPTGKSTTNLIVVVATGAAASSVALSLYYLFSGHFRSYAQGLFRKCFA